MASETHMRPCGKHFRSVCVVISALIAVPGVYWTAVQGYTGAAVLYTVCMIPVLAAMAMLLAEELRGRIRFPLLLAAMGATLLASLPLVVKNYAFHDDWWSVCAQAPDNAVSLGISLSRPFFGVQNAVYQLISDGRYRFLPLARAGMIAAFLVFVLLVYLCLLDFTRSERFSALACMLMGGSIVAVDLNAYASIMPYSPALALSAFAVLFWRKNRSVLKYVVVFAPLFSAFCFYQIATPVILALWAAALLIKRKPLWKDALCFCGVYAGSAVGYLIVAKTLQYAYDAYEKQGRGAFIALDMVWDKFTFFAARALPEALQRVMLILSGRRPAFQNSRSYFFVISPDAGFEPAVRILSGILLGIALLWIASVFAKKHKRLDALLALVFVPGAYWPFLVLRESGTNGYNLFPLVLMLFLLVLCGLRTAVSAVRRRLQPGKGVVLRNIMLPLCFLYACVMCAGAAQYAWQGWSANLNRSITLMTDQLEGWNGERIHIYGSLVQEEPVRYGENAAKVLLYEMTGADPDSIDVTSSSQMWFRDSIPPEEYAALYAQASEEDRKLLDRCYREDGVFINGSLEEELRPQLQELLEEAGLLPKASEDVRIIDMRDGSSPFRFL